MSVEDPHRLCFSEGPDAIIYLNYVRKGMSLRIIESSFMLWSVVAKGVFHYVPIQILQSLGLMLNFLSLPWFSLSFS